MKPTAFACLALGLLLPPSFAAAATPAAYPSWQHSGALTILTTPDGANLPASASVEQFPLLVRLHRDWFDFSKAQPHGEDVRFSSETGEALAFEIEAWDVGDTASIWVRVPRIVGNSRQTLRIHWGKADAVSESNARAVFNDSNGYLSVWHMGHVVRDEVGTLESNNLGTTYVTGIIGFAQRFFAGKQGVSGGDKITTYPTGASAHSSEAWFRPQRTNSTIMAWGNEQAQGKVVMQFRSPPHVSMDCYFSGGNVTGASRVPLGEWTHVVHTYREGESILYVNGVQDGVNTKNGPPLAIKSPARLWLGGWYNNYDFIGDLDEVRVSKVTRSADWVRLQYENQKPLQTVVGPIVPAGAAFAVSPAKATVMERKKMAFTAQAGGAQKIVWSVIREGVEKIAAVDRLSFVFEAGRVTGDTSVKVRLKVVTSDGVKTRDIPIAIREAIADPEFTLRAPAVWDGRATIEVVPQIANLAAMRAGDAADLKTEWRAGPFAVIKEIGPLYGRASLSGIGRFETYATTLFLKRAQNNGKLTVTATISNGGKPISHSVDIAVKEPTSDPWVMRIAAKDEQPEDGQFYARDEKNEGTLFYNGTLTDAADSVFLKLYADDKLVQTEAAQPGADKSYALSVKLKPGLIRYKVEFGTKTGGRETLLRTVGNLVCGDAYLIEGQSNALATDTREQSPPETNEWIRSYGRAPANAKDASGNLWCHPVWKVQKGEKAELGWWGMELAKRLLASQKLPIFMINAAVGGTRIDQHQRNATDPTDLTTIYGRMLWRVRQAKLTHGIRGILWHQGENDQGADGPMGGYGWETYQPLFVEMAAGWKQDLPNVQHYYVFQIWPNSCSMGGRDGAGDRLREKQRTLPELFSNLSVISTLGVRPPGGCHFPLDGWAEFARLIQPLIERDHYGKVPAAPITPPNLRRASQAGGAKNTIALEFDQPVVWAETLAGQFYLDGQKDQVASGRVAGNVLTLKLKEASAAKTITYLKEVAWSQDTLLNGANGLAALTFCEVPILSSEANP